MIEEILHPAYALTGERASTATRLIAQQDLERAERNAATLLCWHIAFYGPIVGPQLAEAAGPDRHLALLRVRGAI